MKIVVTKEAVRQYIREVMANPQPGWQSTGDMSNFPVSTSAVVDPSAAQSDPGNSKFVPKNRMELRSAMSTVMDDVADDDAPSFYQAVQDVLSDKKKEEEKMNKQDKQVEEAIRRTIRKMLSEAEGPSSVGLGGMIGGPKLKPGFVPCEQCEEGELPDGSDCPVCKGTGQVASGKRKNVMMGDVGGATFKEIAKELGFASESGAKQAGEKALQKLKYRMELPPDELEILTLTAMSDYIDFLNKSGELTAADVQLMKDHPNIVATLDGFREFLDGKLKKAQKAAGAGDF